MAAFVLSSGTVGLRKPEGYGLAVNGGEGSFCGRWEVRRGSRQAVLSRRVRMLTEEGGMGTGSEESSVQSEMKAAEGDGGVRGATGETPQPTKKERKVGGRKSLLKPDGTPYAWWLRVAEGSETTVKKRPKTDATGRLARDPQEAELSGVGLSYKMLGDEVELRWATGNEKGNRGFVVSRRAGKSSIWEKVADYRNRPAELLSKGPQGGQYSFIVSDATPGSWIYRVSDVDASQKVSDLSQCLIEIDSTDDRKQQMIALVALLLVGALMFAAGLYFDPLSGTT